MMAAWWLLQGIVLLLALVSEWAVRSGQADGRRWMRVLVVVALVGALVPRPASGPVERLVPVQAAIERLAPVEETVTAAAEMAQMPVVSGFAWLAIALALGLAALLAARRWRLVRDATPMMGVGAVRVVVSPRVHSPMTVFLGRHWIVLDPATAADPSARHLAVMHEAQHIRHHDTLGAWFYVGLAAVCAPNPFVWRLVRNLSELDEFAVDRALVRDRRVSPRAYGRLLLQTATRGSLLSATPGLAHTTPLHRRLAMLTSTSPTRRAPWLVAVVAVALAGVFAPPAVTAGPPSAAVSEAAGLGIPDHAVVHAAVERLTVDPRGARFIEAALRRRPEHRDFVRKALEEAGLPLELEAVVLIESGYDEALGTSSIDSAAPADGPPGAGLWMFIPSTAREYGLQVDERVDERFDVQLETDAAIALLSDLHDEFGDWGLALAAYNQGPRHVRKAIDDAGTRDVPTLVEQGALNRYVPMVWAGMLILAAE